MSRTLPFFLAACGAATAQQMCWDIKSGYSAVRGLVNSPKKERRPESFYFGETRSFEECQALCGKTSGCAAYTWMGGGADRGGWLGGGAKWTNQCYGRGAQVMTMVPEKGRTSGIMVPCSQLEEMERSFGANPARLYRADAGKPADAEPTSAGAKRVGAGGAGGMGGGAGGGEDEATDLMSMLRDGGAGKAGGAGAAEAKSAQQQKMDALLGRQGGGGGKPAAEEGEMDLMSMLRGGGKAGGAGGAGGAG
eukprot:4489367-Prymnesium_polylepis.1